MKMYGENLDNPTVQMGIFSKYKTHTRFHKFNTKKR